MFKVKNIINSTGNPAINQFAVITNNYIIMQSYDTPIIRISRKLNKHGAFTISIPGDPWGYSTTTSKYVNLFLQDHTFIDAIKLRRAIKAHQHSITDRLTTYEIKYVKDI